jgi:hypothetical protein
VRIESSVTAVSWIPSEAISGFTKLPFETGITHYDAPPPDRLGDLEAWRVEDRFREANELRAYIEVEDGRIVGHGHLGRGRIGSTRVRLGRAAVTFPALALPDLRPEPEVGPDSVRFVQTVGGRTGLPSPRPVPRKPFFQLWSAIAWTTLALTIRADGSSQGELIGASPFPRHWVYDADGTLVAKSGVTDFAKWFSDSFGDHTPWGSYDSPALVTAVETAMERQLSGAIMHGDAAAQVRHLKAGDILVRQGDAGDEVYLLLDGVLAVDVDDDVVAEVGPGAILGERAILEGGRRSATLRAVTPCRIAVTSGERLDAADLAAVAAGHRREEAAV